MSENHHPEDEIEPAEVLDLYGLSQTADYLIAKIKAEALRGAALMFSSRLGSSYSGVAVRGMLDARADRIEGAFNE